MSAKRNFAVNIFIFIESELETERPTSEMIIDDALKKLKTGADASDHAVSQVAVEFWSKKDKVRLFLLIYFL
jgi:hypothetical protein